MSRLVQTARCPGRHAITVGDAVTVRPTAGPAFVAKVFSLRDTDHGTIEVTVVGAPRKGRAVCWRTVTIDRVTRKRARS